MTKSLQFKVRLDEELHRQIKEAADANNRSLNTEIIERLRETINQDQIADKADDIFSIDSTRGFARVGKFYEKYSKDSQPNKDVPELQQAFCEEVRERLTAIEKKLDK